MNNLINYDSLNVDSGAFSLEKFIESDAPGTLAWLNLEDNYQDNYTPSFKEAECSIVVSPFDDNKVNKEAMPCRHLCAGCKRWQVESSGETNFPEKNNPETK